ncbi:alginate export family protein [Thiomicrorhabdus sp. 6S2-11]|uniref:Alginate export family protein n=1 Tax=Thiomicrorhabdus marina TaxID=2818442 RepID=A0ABS3Q4H5_9GAMM|nr:alginate export family protein [Thiomicrorhabdus marina]MBO1927239.1 alginate export family protein [Thiomicrorhabdus marina]
MSLFNRYTMLAVLSSGQLLLLPSSAAANTELFFEIRERAEHQENLNDKFYGIHPKVGESSDSYLLSRVRIGLNHQFDENWSGRVSLQDSRVFGWGFEDENWVNGEFDGIENNPQSDPLELGQAWLQYKDDHVLAKVGRQSLSYGNQRVFGPGAWKNSGKWIWDAAKLRVKQGKNWLDAFYGKTMTHDPDQFSLEHRHGFTGSGLYGHFQLSRQWLVEPMLFTKFNDYSQSYQEKDQLNYGARVLYQDYGFKVDATVIKQVGDVLNNAGQVVDIDAYGYNFDANYRLSPQWMFGVTHSFASGDDKSTAQNERFDGAYGAAAKYYGHMNVMAWSNLADYGVIANYRPLRDWDIQAEYHQFYADEMDDAWKAYKTGLSAQSDHYGDELDLIASYRYSKQLDFKLGLGVFMPGDGIKQAVANGQTNLTDDNAYSGFFQIQYKFKQSL